MQNKTVLILLLSLAFLIFFASYAYVSLTRQDPFFVFPTKITNFEECAAAGFPIMESYPEKCSANNKTFTKEYGNITMEEAQTLAREQCVKGGETVTLDKYEQNTGTWWFAANLNTTQPGCQSFCVVNEKDASTNIEWVCDTIDSKIEIITELFKRQYPQYADTLSVTIDLDEGMYIRGAISFDENPEAPGGIFLARMANGTWEINYDGNGEISCNLRTMGYPDRLISDCAEY